MLCYKDVANVINENGTDKIETKNAVNASLEKVNGSLFGDTSWYWSSSENTRYHNEAFEVGFSKGKVTAYPKYWYKNFVRAVCAF